MRLKIDIEKSIEKRRLITTSWYFKVIDYFIYSFFAIVFIICIIGPTEGVPIKIDLTRIILISIVLVLLFIEILALYKMDDFAIINSYNSKLDRNYFMLLAKESKWSVVDESDNTFIFNANHWFFHERQVTIIKENNNIFINVMSFGKNDMKSTIYMRRDRKILNQIIEKIKINAT